VGEAGFRCSETDLATCGELDRSGRKNLGWILDTSCGANTLRAQTPDDNRVEGRGVQSETAQTRDRSAPDTPSISRALYQGGCDITACIIAGLASTN
jgi:hypothetical protein